MVHLISRAGLAVAALLLAHPGQGVPPASASPPLTGTVCLISTPDPTTGEKSLFNDTAGNPVPDYSVQFGAGAIIAVPHSPKGKGPGVLVTDLPLDASPLVRIRHQGKPIEAFKLHFDAEDRGNACLFVDSFYLTWQFWAATRLRACGCQGATEVSWKK